MRLLQFPGVWVLCALKPANYVAGDGHPAVSDAGVRAVFHGKLLGRRLLGPAQRKMAWERAAKNEAFRLERTGDRVSLRVGETQLSGHAIAVAVKRLARAAGIDPSTVSGHSLRAGLATSAAKAGKSERAIMKQTGHRSATMMRRYIRDADLFSENAAAGLL